MAHLTSRFPIHELETLGGVTVQRTIVRKAGAMTRISEDGAKESWMRTGRCLLRSSPFTNPEPRRESTIRTVPETALSDNEYLIKS